MSVSKILWLMSGTSKQIHIFCVSGVYVASLTVPGGQEFHFPHFPKIFTIFSTFFWIFSHLHPYVSPLGGRVAQKSRSVQAIPLFCKKTFRQSPELTYAKIRNCVSSLLDKFIFFTLCANYISNCVFTFCQKCETELLVASNSVILGRGLQCLNIQVSVHVNFSIPFCLKK